jgi:AcrR family transcriptional regulator
MTTAGGPGERVGSSAISGDAVLDAVRDCVLAVGVRRTTLSDVARRAGVSRMTIYRRWPDVRTLVGDLMTREWQEATDATLGALPGATAQSEAAAGREAAAGPEAAGPDAGAGSRAKVVASLVAGTRIMREHPLVRKIVSVDPELFLPYLFDRRGASQDYFLEVLAAVIVTAQRDGSVRAGDPALIARAILLTTQSFTMSAVTMTEPGGTDLDRLDAELANLLDAYLTPARS